MEYPRMAPCGDRALMVEFGNSIDPVLNARVQQFARSLQRHRLPGVLQVVPSYCSVLIEYDPVRWPGDTLDERLAPLINQSGGRSARSRRHVDVPVWYSGEDLADVAAHAGLTEAEVIELHAGTMYTVYCVGFTPGFAYLGRLPRQLHVPRLPNPRTRVPAGSVAIGGQQTGVYPSDSPGGWRLIGMTRTQMFHPARKPPSLLRAGDSVRFVPISREAYEAGGGDSA